ncbi:anti-sigma factor family protein [Acidocella sp.]|jgi:anti-sigma factor RsiW|uniref:anti-sigma factor family protein n=1 Tax=Acidocella sp. TaxID=50710 RepID=UPI002F428220
MNHESYSEQLNAMLDGELRAAEIVPLARHITACQDCAKHLTELIALRAALQQEYPEEDVSSEFYEKIAGLLDREIQQPESPNVIPFRPRPVRRRIAWLAAGTAIAAMLAILLLPHQNPTQDLMSVRDAALRGSLSPTVAVNNSGPAIPGFRLTASRSDIVAGHPARVLAYSKDSQTITLCIWSADGEAAHGIRDAVYKGMAISYWNDGKQEYWAATTGTNGLLENFVAAAKNI